MNIRFLALVVFGLALATTAMGLGPPNSWIDGNGKWETSNNWSRLLAPSLSDGIDLITNAGFHTVTIDAATTNFPGTLNINALSISAPPGSSNTLFLNNLGPASPLQLGVAFNGLNVSTNGSLVIVNSSVKIQGQTPFVDGSLLLNGGFLVTTNPPVANTFYVGLSTPGQMTLSNGTAIFESIRIASGTLTMAGATTNVVDDLFENFGSTWINGGLFLCTNLFSDVRSLGQMTVSNGTIISTSLEVGSPNYGHDGTLTVNGGTIQVASSFYIGYNINAFGHVTIAGGSVFVTNSTATAVTDVRYGTLVLTSGVFRTDSLFVTNSHGSFINNGGVFSVTGVAQTDQGTQIVSSGSTTLSSNLLVGSTLGSTSTLIVVGGTLTVTNGPVNIGNDGTAGDTGGVAQVTVSGGLFQAASILVGDNFGSPSSFTISSNGHVIVQGGLRVNGNHTTTVTDNGTLDVLVGPAPPFEDPTLNNRIVVASGADGTMIVSNGTVNAPEMVVGLSTGNTGSLVMNGGVVSLSSNLLVGLNASATGLVMISGGTLTATNGTFSVGNSGTAGSTGGVARVTVSGGLLQTASILVGDSFGSPSSFAVAGSGHVVVQGGLRVNGNHTTTINGGTLEVLVGTPPAFEDPVLRNRIVIAYHADGTLIVSNGAVRTPSLVVGVSAGNTGTLAFNGGVMTVDSNLVVGDCGLGAVGLVLMSGGTLYVTNATHNAVLDVRDGQFLMTGGMLVADKLVMTNACGLFQRIGGITVIGSMMLDPNLSASGDGIPNGWALQYGLDTLNPAEANADPDGDGFSNLQEYLAGTNPTDPASSPFRITSIVRQGNDVVLTWTTVGGKTNVVQVAAGGNYSSNAFVTLSAPIAIPGTSVVSTNFTDVGGATNAPSRFYRVKMMASQAADDTGDPAYSAGWTNGSNGGMGFSPWTLTTTTNDPNQNGFFEASSTNNAFGTGPSIDVAGKSWGLYANSGNFATAYRAFANGPLLVGQSFLINMDNGFIDTGNTDGFVLRNGNASSSPSDYNVDARFEFLYIGNDTSNSYKVVDAGGMRNIGVPFTGTGLRLVFTLTTANTYTLLTINNASGATNTFSGTLQASGSVDSLAIYNRNAGGGTSANCFFNSLEIISP